jgi:glycosyltransferase involved in cell wall biosynthesis
VIVLSKNNGRTIGYTLLSLLRAKVPSGYRREIIVVDAKSSDITPKILSSFGKFIKVVYDEGRGIGIARNIGVSSSRGDIICFVDADCVVSEDHFLRIIGEFENGADIIDVKGSSPRTETIIEKMESILWLKGRAYSEELTRNRCFAGGAFISFRREVFEKIGGFWKYPPYGGDDLDFSYRGYLAGFKIKVVDVPGTYSRPRRGVRELFKQQMGWGKGYAHIIAKYRHDVRFWKCYGWNHAIYRILNGVIFFYPILAALVAPLKGLVTAIRLREWNFLPFWVLRRWAFLLGILTELPKAFATQRVSV